MRNEELIRLVWKMLSWTADVLNAGVKECISILQEVPLITKYASIAAPIIKDFINLRDITAKITADLLAGLAAVR